VFAPGACADRVQNHTHWSELRAIPLKSSINSAELCCERDAGSPVRTRVGAMTSTQITERPRGPRTDARSVRRALRAEKAQLLRWRRLLRSRLDLAVAGYAPPDTLGAMSWDILPDAQMSLPKPQDLIEAMNVGVTEDEVALMQRLRRLDRQLAAYGARLDAALEASTQEIMCSIASPGPDLRDDAR
jgi:hypothetical protein